MQNHHDRSEMESHAAELLRQFETYEPTDRPLSLWITCHDECLDRAVERIQECGPVLMWRWPSARLPSDRSARGKVLSAIEYAVHELGIRKVVLCGHSQCESLRSARGDDEVDSCSTFGESESFYDRMVRRVNERMRRLGIAQDDLVSELVDFENEACIRRLIIAGKLQLTGLFYLTESRAFLLHDELTGAFIPLDQAVRSSETAIDLVAEEDEMCLSRTAITERFVCSYQPKI